MRRHLPITHPLLKGPDQHLGKPSFCGACRTSDFALQHRAGCLHRQTPPSASQTVPVPSAVGGSVPKPRCPALSPGNKRCRAQRGPGSPGDSGGPGGTGGPRAAGSAQLHGCLAGAQARSTPQPPGTGGSLCWRLSQAWLVLSGGSAGTGQSQPPSATFICKGQFTCAGQEVTELALLTLSPLSSVSPFSLVLPTLERAGTSLRLEKHRTPLLELQLHGITQAAE